MKKLISAPLRTLPLATLHSLVRSVSSIILDRAKFGTSLTGYQDSSELVTSEVRANYGTDAHVVLGPTLLLKELSSDLDSVVLIDLGQQANLPPGLGIAVTKDAEEAEQLRQEKLIRYGAACGITYDAFMEHFHKDLSWPPLASHTFLPDTPLASADPNVAKPVTEVTQESIIKVWDSFFAFVNQSAQFMHNTFGTSRDNTSPLNLGVGDNPLGVFSDPLFQEALELPPNTDDSFMASYLNHIATHYDTSPSHDSCSFSSASNLLHHAVTEFGKGKAIALVPKGHYPKALHALDSDKTIVHYDNYHQLSELLKKNGDEDALVLICHPQNPNVMPPPTPENVIELRDSFTAHHHVVADCAYIDIQKNWPASASSNPYNWVGDACPVSQIYTSGKGAGINGLREGVLQFNSTALEQGLKSNIDAELEKTGTNHATLPWAGISSSIASKVYGHPHLTDWIKANNTMILDFKQRIADHLPHGAVGHGVDNGTFYLMITLPYSSPPDGEDAGDSALSFSKRFHTAALSEHGIQTIPGTTYGLGEKPCIRINILPLLFSKDPDQAIARLVDLITQTES